LRSGIELLRSGIELLRSGIELLRSGIELLRSDIKLNKWRENQSRLFHIVGHPEHGGQ
jgi:hypothetical protein